MYFNFNLFYFFNLFYRHTPLFIFKWDSPNQKCPRSLIIWLTNNITFFFTWQNIMMVLKNSENFLNITRSEWRKNISSRRKTPATIITAQKRAENEKQINLLWKGNVIRNWQRKQFTISKTNLIHTILRHQRQVIARYLSHHHAIADDLYVVLQNVHVLWMELCVQRNVAASSLCVKTRFV